MQEIRPNLSKRFHFSSNDDLYLLREVVGQNLYHDEQRWNIVQVNLLQIFGRCILIRTLKDRVKKLVNKFLEKDKDMKFKFGVEVEITEIDDLLRMVADLMRDLKKPDKRSRKPADTSYQKGLAYREQVTNLMVEKFPKDPVEHKENNAVRIEIVTNVNEENADGNQLEEDIIEDPQADPELPQANINRNKRIRGTKKILAPRKRN